MAQVKREIESIDTCARCGLRRARPHLISPASSKAFPVPWFPAELEAPEGVIRLCDDCYLGEGAARYKRHRVGPARRLPLSVDQRRRAVGPSVVERYYWRSLLCSSTSELNPSDRVRVWVSRQIAINRVRACLERNPHPLCPGILLRCGT
jgi:hypothetical protein